MRWSIPTLIQQLVDQGVPLAQASYVVGCTYPETLGDTFYRHRVLDDPNDTAVGVYGLWNSLRGDQSPLDGGKVSEDARTIAQFGRLNGWQIEKIVYISGMADEAIATIVRRTADAIRAGDYFEPQEILPEPVDDPFVQRLQQAIATIDGADDYLRSIDIPRFGA